MLQVRNLFPSALKKPNSREYFPWFSRYLFQLIQACILSAAQTGTEESGKFHFQPYLQDIDKETGRDYAA